MRGEAGLVSCAEYLGWRRNKELLQCPTLALPRVINLLQFCKVIEVFIQRVLLEALLACFKSVTSFDF